MADEEAEQDSGRLGGGGGGGGRAETGGLPDMPSLKDRLLELETGLRESREPAVEASAEYCQQLCQTLLEYAEKWKTSDDPLPLLEVYTEAIHSYVKAQPYLTAECENVALVLERLALSYVELLLCLPLELPENKWKEIQSFIQMVHTQLMQNGSCQLNFLSLLGQENGMWKNLVLCSILSQEPVDQDKVNEFLKSEGPVLLDMRIKHLMKSKQLTQATSLAKLCSDHPEISSKGNFKQTYLVCLCSGSPNEKLMQEIADIDCKDALEMICNLESEGDVKSALILCAAFLSRQLQQGEMYCAWELTLFWSKLQQRVEPSVQTYLERCRQLSVLTKTVYHIFFLIKVINSEIDSAGLATCIELCVKALRLEASENKEVKISVCKTISCLLPDDLEVKRACQLSEFLLEPTVDAYYAVEMLYNQPDQKYDEENLPIPNSLRCELLLVLKTQWPFDPEFWDWKMLKRQCLALMGEEASIVSSIDELNDTEMHEKVEDCPEENKEALVNGLSGCFDEATNLLRGIRDRKQKNREIKKLRERGFISARFRNWQAYMQYCVLCDKEFLGHRIVRHAQKHYKDGIYSCPICAQNFNFKETFVPHVTLHVKKSSKERLAAMKPLRKLGRPPKTVATGVNKKNSTVIKQEQRHIKKNSLYTADFIVFNDNDGSDDENYEKDKPYIPDVTPVQKPLPVNEFTCPVTLCKKGFKYFKNLIAHAKGHKDSEEAKRFLEMQSKKVICQYCRRHFVSVTHLNDHLQMHCGSKPYICIQMKCKASFNSYAELLSHRKEHPVFRAKCMFPKCGRVFSEAYLLYDHEAQHYNTFTCKFSGCGKVYRSQDELEKHIEDHSKSEKTLQSEGDSNSSQSLNGNESAEGTHPEDALVLPPDDSVNNCAKAETCVTDQIKDESGEAERSKISSSVLEHTNSTSIEILQESTPAPVKAESVILASNNLMPLLGQKIRENMARKGKLPSVSSKIDIGVTAIQQLCSAVEDNCSDPTIFQQEKEDDCVSHSRIISMNSAKPEPEIFRTESPEKEKGHLSSSAPGQIEYQTLLSAKPPFEESIKTVTDLCNLSLKTLEGTTVAPAENNLGATPFVPVPLATPVQKFACQVEGCTRIYNSSQSIGKHMKTAHPDQYAVFKMQRKNKKNRKANSLQNLPNDTNIVYFLPSQMSTPTNDAFPQAKISSNPTCTSQLQQLSNALFPTRLENMTNPLLPNVENVRNTGLSSHIKSEPENTLDSQLGSLSGATLPSQLDDLEKPIMPLNIDSGSDPFLPLPAENGPISLFSSSADNCPSSVFSQMENNINHFPSHLDGSTNSFPKDDSVDMLFSSQVSRENSFSETTPQPLVSEKAKKDRRHGSDGKDKKPKHSKRAKWPAIIRDGKFICSRCYRVFSNPRSLGGHLSKRSYCKPLEESEISPEALQLNGQSSLLASMILSSNALSLQQQQESAFNPEACFKEPSFLQLLATENRPATFLQNLFPRTNMTNFNASENDEGNEIIKQALETAGIPSTFDPTEILPHVTTTSCVTDSAQISATVLPSPGVSPLLPTVCNPTTLLTDQNRTLDTRISSVEECNSFPVLPDDLILKTFENGLCSNMISKSSAAVHNFGSNASRVSVISTVRGSDLCNLNKKGTSGSKKKKKATPPLVVPDSSQSLVVNDVTALGLPARNVEGGMQMSTEDFQPNILASCEAQVLMVKNLAQKLSNVDSELAASIKENLKTSHEAAAEIAPLAMKSENRDSPATVVSCTPENSNLGMSEDNGIQNLEKTGEIIKTATNPQMVEVKTEMHEISIESLQKPQITAVQSSENLSLIVKPFDLPQYTHNVTLSNTILSQPETSHKDDSQIIEILEGLKKLKLEGEASDQLLDNMISCLPENAMLPLIAVPVVTTENTTLIQPSLETHPPLGGKIHKPFMCQVPGCNYSAMTKDALFKHYSKIHQYTAEMILEIKKHQLKYAPFKCVVPSCPKTFTRNSNLRAHCQLVHHFTTEEMVKLKLKRPYGRRSQTRSASSASRSVELKKLPCVLLERKIESQLTEEVGVKEETQREYVKVPEMVIPERIMPAGIPDAPEELENTPKVLAVPSECPSLATLSSMQVQPKLRKIRRHRKEKEERKHTKPVNKSLESPATYSPYRPYRCVHQGCFAAFTIQQNLILHYKAVHKSDLLTFSQEAEEESEPSKEEDCDEEEHCDETETTTKEFRCEIRNCSRIFQEVTSLIQHYLKLHEMTPEEIGSMRSAVDVGRFPCDQSECKSSFTAYFSYIIHLETDHGIKLKQAKTEDGMYKCDCEGCDRIYATRSNLLRHIFNKHNDRHKDHLIRPRRFLTPGQENISSKANQEKNIKIKHKGLKYRTGRSGNKIIRIRRRKAICVQNKNFTLEQIPDNNAYSLKCGKYVYLVKTRDDALSECTNRFITQYPCMIKGCSSVVTSENNIIRHYKCHKLSKAFTSQHRNLLIICNKYADSVEKEASSQSEVIENKVCDVKELQPHSTEVCEDMKPPSPLAEKEPERDEKDEVDELAELFITKLINEDLTGLESNAKVSSEKNSDCPETKPCLAEKQNINGSLKRISKEKNLSQTKKRKVGKQEEILAVELSSRHREEETAVAVQTTEEPSSAFDWSSFKPMGFEVSFLKFLEESAVKQKRNTERNYNCGTRKGSHSHSRKSNDKNSCPRTRSCSENGSYVLFANSSQFQCSGTVKIVLDKTFKDCTELVLKQLQEMKPIVSLIRLDG